jgi:hypothetical protein
VPGSSRSITIHHPSHERSVLGLPSHLFCPGFALSRHNFLVHHGLNPVEHKQTAAAHGHGKQQKYTKGDQHGYYVDVPARFQHPETSTDADAGNQRIAEVHGTEIKSSFRLKLIAATVAIITDYGKAKGVIPGKKENFTFPAGGAASL